MHAAAKLVAPVLSALVALVMRRLSGVNRPPAEFPLHPATPFVTTAHPLQTTGCTTRRSAHKLLCMPH